jgi:hypothetical protein
MPMLMERFFFAFQCERAKVWFRYFMFYSDGLCPSYGRVVSKCKVSTEFLLPLTWAHQLLSHESLHPPRHPVTAVAAQVSDKGNCIRDEHTLRALLRKKVSCDKYCLFLRRMQFTCTGWVQSLNTRDDGRGKTYRPCQKPNHFMTFLPLIAIC